MRQDRPSVSGGRWPIHSARIAMAAWMSVLSGCVSHVTVVRPLTTEKQSDIEELLADRTAAITVRGEREKIGAEQIRFADGELRFRKIASSAGARAGAVPQTGVPLPEAALPVAGVEKIEVRSPGRGALQGLGFGLLAGAGLTAVAGAIAVANCSPCDAAPVVGAMAGTFLFSCLLGAGVGAAIGARTLVEFQEPSAPALVCAPLIEAEAARGTELHAAPDGRSAVIARLREAMAVCAERRTEGFGFRRVKLSDGREGFIRESDLSE